MSMRKGAREGRELGCRGGCWAFGLLPLAHFVFGRSHAKFILPIDISRLQAAWTWRWRCGRW